MSRRRSYRATALIGLVLAAVVAAVFLFGNPTAHTPGKRAAIPDDAAPAPAPVAAAPDAAGSAPSPAADRFAGIDVQLARVGAAPEAERLPVEAEVRLGDRLRFGISSDRPLHVYAFNQVQGAAPTVMFPLAVLDTRNPLLPGEHELPGTVQGEHQSYTVEANAPLEEVLLVLAEQPLPVIEARVAALSTLTSGPQSGDGVTLEQIAAEAGEGVVRHRWTLRHIDDRP